MAEKLYYQDAYMKEFSAAVTECREIEGRTALALDRTAFYPEGGGQRPDCGQLRIEGVEGAINVTDVQEEQGEIWHFIDAGDIPVPEAGQKVNGRIDWERRFDHMQQHSGEHIISGMICRTFHCDNIGFHMGEEDVTIDYNAKISLEEVKAVEDAANRYLWENHPFEEVWPSEEELKSMEYRSKKELEGDVRITSFPGADCCACCGTHVKSSAEVGLIKITSVHSFHDGTRFTLYCGKRAMDFLSMNYHANKNTAVLLSTREDRTPEVVQKQIEELTSLRARFTQIQEDYFRMWADSFRGEENVLVVSDRLEAEEGRKLADLIADRIPGLAAVFTKVSGKDGETSYRYACMQRNDDLSAWTKQMNAGLSGKGGGRGGFVQGTVNAKEKEIREFFATQFSHS